MRMSRREEKWLRWRAGLGNGEAISEIERRGLASEAELSRWKSIHEEKRVAMLKARESLGIKKEKEDKVEKEVKKEDPELEMTIVRIGPNPRILVCGWWTGAKEHEGDWEVRNVKVKSTDKFVRGMKLKVARELVRKNKDTVSYEGELPRYKGRW